MANILSGITNFLLAVLNILKSVLDGFGQLFFTIPRAFGMLSTSITYLPSVLVAFAIAMVSVSVVYLIIGR